MINLHILKFPKRYLKRTCLTLCATITELHFSEDVLQKNYHLRLM